MNRFLLFAYDSYYPAGGMSDCVFMSNDPTEIISKWTRCSTEDEYSEVYDCEKGRNYEALQEFVERFG